MDLVNATRKAIDSGVGGADPAVREAAEVTAMMLDMYAPYTAEDMWATLGHQATVAHAVWPSANPALLIQESVTAVVQVDGKVRDRLEVSPNISEGDLQALAMELAGVVRSLEGREIVNVIVRAPKLVNIATKPVG
jgi:leucyl-tRNA synthetase